MDGGFNYDTQGSIEYCNFIGRGNLVGGGTGIYMILVSKVSAE